jgi:hypothetical protein
LLYWTCIVDIYKSAYNILSWILPLHHSPLSPIIPFLEEFQEVIFFCFNNEYIIFLHSFLISPSLPLLPTPSQDLFYLPVLGCWKKTLLFKIVVQKVSLWHFHMYIYMYYIPNWFTLSIFLSTLVPFWCDFNKFKYSIFILVLKVHQPYIHSLPHVNALPLAWPTFHSCPSLFRCLYCSVRFLSWYYTCICIVLKSMQSTPLHFLTRSSHLVLFNSF